MKHFLVVIASGVALTGCATIAPVEPPPQVTPAAQTSATQPASATTPLRPASDARARMKTIESYTVYYGVGKADALANYDLAIVQPDTLTTDEISQLHQKGTLAVAYLSVGEVEPNRPWYSDGRVDPKWILGRNDNWGSYYIDAGQNGWQTLMVQLTGETLAKGYDGIFMDTLDTVDVQPQTKQGMIDLVKKLREAYPQAVLVQNRGFTVIRETASTVDALMLEDVSTGYDFAKKEYLWQDNAVMAEEAVALKNELGIPILALDYAPPDNPAMAYRAMKVMREYGFVPAVSVINLDDIPDYGIANGGPADVRVRSISAESAGDEILLVAKLQNVGLTDASQVPWSLMVDGTELATTTRDMPIGDEYEWRVPWPNAPGQAVVIVSTAASDGKAENNTREWRYNSAAVQIEPLLPLAEQKLRPDTNGPQLIASQLTAPPNVDGDLSEWANLPCTEVNTPEQVSFGDPKGWSGPDDLSGRVCYGWMDKNLYVAFDVTDDLIVQGYSGASLYKGDHVELWFDTQLQLDFDAESNSDDDFQIGVSPGNFESRQPELFIFTPPTSIDSYSDKVAFAVKRTATGYSAELMLPGEVLRGLRFAPDHAIGATFEPSDTDTPGGSEQENMLSTAPTSSSDWGNPTKWNTLLLKGE